MHIPDGFLDTKTIVATTALSVVGLGIAWRRTKVILPRTRVPLMGVSAAFVFAAQMLNFPVAGGTSGHLIGAVLTSVLLGPAASVIVITAVLVVQCFLFADGGLLALGANTFNMALVASMGGYSIYQITSRLITGEQGRIVSVAFASWCSVVLASMCCAGELSWSGTVSAGASFPAMIGTHAMIGLGEALITSFVITAINKVRPDLLISSSNQDAAHPYRDVIVFGSLITVGLILFVLPFASPLPDGLEAVAARLGFDQNALRRQGPAMIPDYRFPGISSTPLALGLAGITGVIIVFLLSFLLAKALMRKSKTQSN